MPVREKGLQLAGNKFVVSDLLPIDFCTKAAPVLKGDDANTNFRKLRLCPYTLVELRHLYKTRGIV